MKIVGKDTYFPRTFEVLYLMFIGVLSSSYRKVFFRSFFRVVVTMKKDYQDPPINPTNSGNYEYWDCVHKGPLVNFYECRLFVTESRVV